MAFFTNNHFFRLLIQKVKSNPRFRQRFWKFWYNFLSRKFRDFDAWTCMNFGYLDSAYKGSPPAEYTSKKLYEDVLNGQKLTGKTVLEVGCGRGGGLQHLHTLHKAGSSIGIDLSEQNIAFCQKRFKGETGLQYLEGSADNLEMKDNSIDFIINVESSHTYPDFEAFVKECFRVLKPGGIICITDFRPAEKIPPTVNAIAETGFSFLRNDNVSQQVLNALNADVENRRAMVQGNVPRWLHSFVYQFAGLPGSKFHGDLSAGRTEYFSVTAEKAA